MQVASPFIVRALGEEPIKIGLNDPFTGTYAELGKHEQIGCQLAIDEINKKGGILGRQVNLDLRGFHQRRHGHRGAEGAQADRPRQGQFPPRQRQLRDGARLGRPLAKAGVLHIVTGGHTDAVTGKDCHWNVFRVCNTTRMETNAVSKLLFDKFGKKWYFITPDYAFGHTLQEGFEASLKKFGGTEVGASLTPLGSDGFLVLPDQGSSRPIRTSSCS